MKSALTPYVITGIALVSAAGIAVAPAAPPAPGVQVRAVQLTAGEITDAGPFDPAIGLVVGASGRPIPGADYVGAANDLYIDNPLHPIYPGTTYPGVLANGVFTPEGLYPMTGVKSLVLNYPLDSDGFPAQSTSVGQGITILNHDINANVAAGHASTVFGYSQGSTLAGLAMEKLDPSGTPSDLPVQYLLIADPSNPNGGLLERFNGYETTSGDSHVLPLNLPALGVSFDGATPADDFTTSIYSTEYDGFADFPRYPLNLLSDLNAFLGIALIHPNYLNAAGGLPGPTAEQIANATLLPGSEHSPTDPCAGCLTDYYLIDHPAPLVAMLPKPLQDLLGPDLTYLINLGYGDGSLGYSDAPANVPTPFGLFPDVSMSTILDHLASGWDAGMKAFAGDLSDPSAVAWAAPSAAVATATAADPASFTDIVNALSSAASSAYAALLPTTDIVNSLVTSLPAYDLSLFTDNLGSGDLIDAFGLPAAATTALFTLAAGFEYIVIRNAVTDISAAFAGL
ncbi:MAG TPA: PE-PPE domain-containing protein [Mycobacterium sp.]